MILRHPFVSTESAEKLSEEFYKGIAFAGKKISGLFRKSASREAEASSVAPPAPPQL